MSKSGLSFVYTFSIKEYREESMNNIEFNYLWQKLCNELTWIFYTNRYD